MLNLLQQFALAIAGAKLKRMFFFNSGAVCRIGNYHGFTQVLSGFACIGQQFLFHFLQTLAEKGKLHLVHVIVFFHREQLFLGDDGRLLSGHSTASSPLVFY